MDSASTAQVFLDTWKSIDYPELHKRFNGVVSSLKSEEARAKMSRKQLAVKTREFRALPESERIANIAALMKSYQKEVDALTAGVHEATGFVDSTTQLLFPAKAQDGGRVSLDPVSFVTAMQENHSVLMEQAIKAGDTKEPSSPQHDADAEKKRFAQEKVDEAVSKAEKAFNARLTDLKSQMSLCKGELVMAKRQNDKLDRQLLEMDSSQARDLTRLNREVTSLLGRNTELRAEVAELRKRAESAAGSSGVPGTPGIPSTPGSVAGTPSLESRIAAAHLQAELDAARKALEEAQAARSRRRSEYEERILRLEEELAARTAELATAANALKANGSNNTAASQAREAESRLAAKGIELERCESELVQQRKKVADLSSQVAALRLAGNAQDAAEKGLLDQPSMFSHGRRSRGRRGDVGRRSAGVMQNIGGLGSRFIRTRAQFWVRNAPTLLFAYFGLLHLLLFLCIWSWATG